MENQRESSRVDANHFISYDVINKSNQIIHSGMALSRDLSRNGIQIEERKEFSRGDKVRLHLAIADDIVDLEGIVRHVEKIDENVFHIGIEFGEIDNDLVEKIAEYYPAILTS